MRTKEAIDASVAAITGPEDTFFWCSMCTGGSVRQIYNIQRAFLTKNLGTLYNVRGHREVHEQLKAAFFTIAEHAIKMRARIMLEWPRDCMYWNDEDYVSFFTKHNF